MNFYNGYTPAERNKKLRASYRVFPNRTHPLYSGSCQVCGNPNTAVEPHSEDYSEPYLWDNPAEYAVCKTCHGRIHKRFEAPFAWAAYKMHVKRGGYGTDLKLTRIAKEVRDAAQELENGRSSVLSALRLFTPKDLWWEALTIDPSSLTATWARPR